jgi:hypothetical protein
MHRRLLRKNLNNLQESDKGYMQQLRKKGPSASANEKKLLGLHDARLKRIKPQTDRADADWRKARNKGLAHLAKLRRERGE